MKELEERIATLERRHRQLHILMGALLVVFFLLGMLMCRSVH